MPHAGGRPPKPLEEKIRLGNPGKRKLPTPVTVIAPIDVQVMTGDGPQTGDELVEAIMAAGAAAWISETDALFTLRLVKDGWDERRQLRRVIDEEGHTQYVVRLDRAGNEVGGRITARPEVAMLRELEKQLTTWLSQLGLNPSDRGRLGLGRVQARHSR